MLSLFKCDLHIHTALSPCAESEMTPPKIIHGARAKGLDILAITDHNSCANTQAVMKAAEKSGITVIPGMEVQTKEEVHLICLFAEITQALLWQEEVYQSLPNIKNKPDVFGPQYLFDAKGNIQAEEERLLLTSTALTVEEVVTRVTSIGGLCFPAHIDRPSYSLLSVLGFIPAGLAVDTVEISSQIFAEEAQFIFPALKDYKFLGSSDAHCLSDLGNQFTNLLLPAKPSFQEITLALQGSQGRKVVPRVKELSLHISDLIQNSIEAEASAIKITIIEDPQEDLFQLQIEDNGRGLSEELQTKIVDPFFTTRSTRRIGLGLPLLKAACERCQGQLKIESTLGKGTLVTATMEHRHIDRAPLGNIIDTLVNTLAAHPDLNLIYTHQVDDQILTFDGPELRRDLEDVPLNNPAVLNWVRNYLTEGLNNIGAEK